MATYYVWSGATGTNAGTSWTNAYTAFGSAVTAATSAGDFIYVHYTHQEELAADITYTFGNNINVISVNKDSSDAPTAMGPGGWVGNSTTNRGIALSNTYKVSIYGITFRTAGSTADSITISGGKGHYVLDTCYLWHGNTASTADMVFGNSSVTTSSIYLYLYNCTLRFGSASQNLAIRGCNLTFEQCTISSAGSAPTTFMGSSSAGSSPPNIKFVGCDLSHITGTLIANIANPSMVFEFAQCKLGANVTVLATQTSGNKSSGAAYVFDCSSGDTHTFFGYYDAFGSCVSDTGIYYTTGAAAQSWKITTTANCSYYTPFTSPFVDFYNTGTSSITPFFEILRDGSTTAYQNDEVWGEFFIKSTSGSTQSTPYADRMALLGTPANQAAGAGTGSWTGEAGSAWSGKIDSGSAVTPAEVGAIRGRVVVGEPSITLYVDPQVRT